MGTLFLFIVWERSGMKREQEKDNMLEIAFELSKVLDCGLDKETLSICMGLLETGVHPEALARAIKKMKKEVEAAKGKADAE